MVVQDVPNVCVVHDRHKVIFHVMNDMKDGSQECYRVQLWLNVKNRWCTRHRKQTSKASSRTRPYLNYLSGCVSRLSRRSLKPFGRN
jgi:hypothetical protein